MRWFFKTGKRSVTEELAIAISSYNIRQVSSLLSDTGKFAVPDERNAITISDKENFINWLQRCNSDFFSVRRSHKKLRFSIIQSMHSLTDNSIILFDDGRYPLINADLTSGEKCGLLINVERTCISGIGFCLLKLKTENPYIYEKRNL